MSQDCTQFRDDGKCMHQDAPRQVFGLADCILARPSSDLRVVAGCALQAIKMYFPPNVPEAGE